MKFRGFTREDWFAFSGCSGGAPRIAEVGEWVVVVDHPYGTEVHHSSGEAAFALEGAEGPPEIERLLADVPFTVDPDAVPAALEAAGFHRTV